MHLHESLFVQFERKSEGESAVVAETRVEHGPSLDHQNLGDI